VAHSKMEVFTMNERAYRFIAHEVGTDVEILYWRDVFPTHRFHRGDVIEECDAKWEIVGVRDTSTEGLWLVDLRRVQ
jgi:hypothetical protein